MPNSCFFGSPGLTEVAEIGESKNWVGSPFSPSSDNPGEPFLRFEKFGGGVRFGGESCNWYCRSVLFRFTVLRRKIGFGGGITVSNRSFLFGRFWFLACVPLAWLTLG